jgi:membrane protein YqaA with SNARE-associated domain
VPQLRTYILFYGGSVNWLSLTGFVPLAILCNTVFPVPFEPVLIAFTSHKSPEQAGMFALIGSICAAFGAAADVKLFRKLQDRIPEKWLRLLPMWSGRRTYVFTFLFALLPLPFSVARLAALRNPPQMIPYQLAVALGRLPRYLLIIHIWPGIGLPDSSGMVLLGLCVGFAVIRWAQTRRCY